MQLSYLQYRQYYFYLTKANRSHLWVYSIQYRENPLEVRFVFLSFALVVSPAGLKSTIANKTLNEEERKPFGNMILYLINSCFLAVLKKINKLMPYA